ncbi:MAG: sigma-54-dependent Fis family transcriptional regulator [Deltaproteobacteria bacterium]|nr:sigma-54-dependent Fis family transcriptional regulator [Deltaproteobacteria bacterium]
MPRKPSARVLVADDHVEMARLLADQLGDNGYLVDVAASGAEALELARSRPPDLVVTDLRMDGVDGLDVLSGIQQIDATVPVIIMTAFGAIDSAIEAIKHGAYHYLTKPFQLQELLVYVERAIADRRLRDDHRALRRLVSERSGLQAMVGRSSAMLDLFEFVERVAPSDAAVLIRGESGTGKELVARALHFLSPRSKRPFVAVSCTSLPEALLESELFGHVQGAFSGALSTRRGLFAEADGGTLLLDEIGDMPPELQAKLLRVLQDNEIRAVGADVTRKIDVRVLAATHQPIEERVDQGAFRADLFYRLNVVPIRVPALRERVEDIPLLVEHFVEKTRRSNPTARVSACSPELLSALADYPWPGNVRELENVVKRLVIVGSGETATLDDLRRHAPALLETTPPVAWENRQPLPLRTIENDYIAWVVRQTGGNKKRAAQILGIDESTLHRREKRGSESGAPKRRQH